MNKNKMPSLLSLEIETYLSFKITNQNKVKEGRNDSILKTFSFKIYFYESFDIKQQKYKNRFKKEFDCSFKGKCEILIFVQFYKKHPSMFVQ
jgi:hypothetical protein